MEVLNRELLLCVEMDEIKEEEKSMDMLEVALMIEA